MLLDLLRLAKTNVFLDAHRYMCLWNLQILQQCILCQSGWSQHSRDEQAGDELLVQSRFQTPSHCRYLSAPLFAVRERSHWKLSD